MKIPKIVGFHATVPVWLRIILGSLPFVVAILCYTHFGEIHRTNNPDSMLMPTFQQMQDSVSTLMFEAESTRKSTPALWADTYASLSNLLLGMFISAVIALAIGLHYGLLRGLDSTVGPLTTLVSFIPPILAVPIVIATVGKDDAGKVALIVLGMSLVMAGNIKSYVQDIPKEFLIKTQTLNASWYGVLYRTYLPLLFPRLIDQLKNNVGTAWFMLFTAEFVAANQGLGYRIYISRRWLDMSVIAPYMLWIAFLSFVLIFCLNNTNRFVSPWYNR